MVKFFKNLVGNQPLVKGSILVFFGSSVANFGGYLFHFIMGRFLGPVNYGVLESLISISSFLNLPLSFLWIVIVKVVAENKDKKETIAIFVRRIIKNATLIGFISFVFFLIFFPFLKGLIRVDSFVLFLGLGLFSFLGIYSSIFSSVLQGLMEFKKFCLYGIINSWSKLIIGVLFVFLGFSVFGAIYAYLLSTVVGLILGYFFIRKYLSVQATGLVGKQPSIKITHYSVLVLITNLILISLFTQDIILARFFLSPEVAGQYASLSILAKIIYFAAFPVVQVMFPMVAEKNAKGEKQQNLVLWSLLMVLVISLGINLIYFLFPGTMVGLLFGEGYVQASSNLGYFGIFILIYSLCSVLLNYFLSISESKIIYFSVIFVLVQTTLISSFHNSISQIIEVNIFCVTGLFLLLFLYLLRNKLKQILIR